MKPIKHGAALKTESPQLRQTLKKEQLRRKAKNDQTYFVLKAANEEIIGRSETYEPSSGRKNGIDSVKRNAGKAKIEDKT